MKQSVSVLGVLILAAATLLGGVIHGRMSRRWGGSAELQKLADRIRELPTEIGSWQMREPQPLSPAAEAELECAGYVGRQYENRETGERVTMAVLLGPAGPISVHTPDVCYSSREYTIQRSPRLVKMGSSEDLEGELWSTVLQSTRLDAGYLSVYYGWSVGGRWSAPTDARFAFAGRPYLYKLQVAGPLPLPADEKASDPSLNFLRAFLPVVRQYLVEPTKE